MCKYTGFAAFFAVFAVTRRVAIEAGVASQSVAQRFFPTDGKSQRRFKRIVHSLVLVAGGVAAGLSYEMVGRPWDHARKAAGDRLAHMSHHRSIPLAMVHKVRAEGLLSIFRDPMATTHVPVVGRNGKVAILRTLGRVGPWGLGFLVWEGLGPGLP